jgi:hypothetical protein
MSTSPEFTKAPAPGEEPRKFAFNLDSLTVQDVGTLAAISQLSADGKSAEIVRYIPSIVGMIDRCYPGGANAIPARDFMTAARNLMSQWAEESNPKA